LTVESLAALERMGEKSARNLVDAIAGSCNRPFGAILFALGIRHIGQSASALLAAEFGDIESLMKASAAVGTLEPSRKPEPLRNPEGKEIEGIGPVLAASLQEFFAKVENRDEIAALQKAGVAMHLGQDEAATVAARRAAASDAANPAAGKTFVLTGTLPTLTRTEATERIEARGGKVAGASRRRPTTWWPARKPARNSTRPARWASRFSTRRRSWQCWRNEANHDGTAAPRESCQPGRI